MRISWEQALSIWWSIFGRGTLYGILTVFVLGFIGGVIAAGTGNPDLTNTYGTVGGYIVSILATILALKQAISKHLLSLAGIANDQST